MQSTSRNKLWVSLVVTVIVVIGISVFVVARGVDEGPVAGDESSSLSQTEQTASEGADASEDERVTIIFTDDGFADAAYTVKPSATVLVRNNSSRSLQFSSDDHPTHRNEPQLNTSVIRPHQATTFVAPDEPGEYGFHDHINAQHTGKLIVE